MTITLDLQPQIEKGLVAQATARGVSLAEYVEEIVNRQANACPEQPPARTGQDLIDACAKMRGLLSDEEVDFLFARMCPLPARSISNERQLPAGHQYPIRVNAPQARSEGKGVGRRSKS